MITVKQLLGTKSNDIWTIAPEASVYEALQVMADKNVGALLVLDAGKLVGIFSERDYARKVILKGKSAKETAIGELMSRTVYYVHPEQTIEACMTLMTERHIRHLPVLEKNALVGVISIGDVLKAIISQQEVVIRDLEHYITGAPH